MAGHIRHPAGSRAAVARRDVGVAYHYANMLDGNTHGFSHKLSQNRMGPRPLIDSRADNGKRPVRFDCENHPAVAAADMAPEQSHPAPVVGTALGSSRFRGVYGRLQ